MANSGFLQDMFGTIAERGRQLLDSSASLPVLLRTGRTPGPRSMRELCRALLSGSGEASGVALARQILDLYAAMSAEDRMAFFTMLAGEFGPDPDRLRDAWSAYEETPTPAGLQALIHAAEPPRQELIRRLNLSPNGTRALVRMREDLLRAMSGSPEAAEALASLEDDLVHLFYSWFNRGFLVLQRISWSTSADILERIIRYEAVHTINGWDDLRRRIQPTDRRCYAFFHPSLIDDPLIFVEVALTREIPDSIQGLLAGDRGGLDARDATTAVFYSISNCQPGLKGISFGSFLIKQVVEELSRDLPSLRSFVTLSPVPGFGAWLSEARRDPPGAVLEDFDPATLDRLEAAGWHNDPDAASELRPLILALAAAYLLRSKTPRGTPSDPVARFHLGNGARLERINWLGDTSPKGLQEAQGLMVNYLYDPATIEANHEVYANLGTIAASKAVERQARLLRGYRRSEAAGV